MIVDVLLQEICNSLNKRLLDFIENEKGQTLLDNVSWICGTLAYHSNPKASYFAILPMILTYYKFGKLILILVHEKVAREMYPGAKLHLKTRAA